MMFYLPWKMMMDRGAAVWSCEQNCDGWEAVEEGGG